MNPGHKRERSHGDDDTSGNEGYKRWKKEERNQLSGTEMDSTNTGARRGQTQQTCKMFFSRSGCTKGDARYYLHHDPGLNPRDLFANKKTLMCNTDRSKIWWAFPAGCYISICPNQHRCQICRGRFC